MAESQSTTYTLREIQVLAGRLHARGTSLIGPDSAGDQRDMMLVAAAVIRGLLNECVLAADTATVLARQRSDIRVDLAR